MMIGGVSGGNSPYVPKPSANGSGDVAQLEQQKKAIQEQLQQIKARPKKSEAEQKAAEKQKENLERKIADIEKKIQELSKNNSRNTMQKPEDAAKAEQEKLRRGEVDGIGDLLDIYV
ncbi:MAG: hypothetical protein RRY10_06575 [Christensenellaceae bacterium]